MLPATSVPRNVPRNGYKFLGQLQFHAYKFPPTTITPESNKTWGSPHCHLDQIVSCLHFNSSMASFANDQQDIAFQTAHINDDKAPETLGAQIACLTIAYIGVILRFLARRLARAQITSDDYATVLALVRCHVYFSAKRHCSMLRNIVLKRFWDRLYIRPLPLMDLYVGFTEAELVYVADTSDIRPVLGRRAA